MEDDETEIISIDKVIIALTKIAKSNEHDPETAKIAIDAYAKIADIIKKHDVNSNQEKDNGSFTNWGEKALLRNTKKPV